MEPYKDKLYVGTRNGAPAIINGSNAGSCICVATITAFPWDPECTIPEEYARMFAAAPEVLQNLRAFEAEVERLQAEIASKDRLLPSLLAEGAAIERARAERAEARAVRAEALVAKMATALKRLEDVAGRMVESVTVEAGCNEVLRGVAILGAVADACTEARAVIARAVEERHE